MLQSTYIILAEVNHLASLELSHMHRRVLNLTLAWLAKKGLGDRSQLMLALGVRKTCSENERKRVLVC